uniref:Uncharacterized protein n=1 Tax=Corethron hystrix TaxID=216773 RepID=A0A7S1FW36_9STRA|mmetsp:Transcript_35401/g.82098  ORF Transcript_35401/g.82098 Transcript_35401/m.82098 type:complete len:102 (+) Transcript_35401:1028-1333(+)
MYLCGLNQSRFQGLINSLNNAFIQGRNKYPQSLTKAYKLSTNWQETTRQKAINKGEMNFLQDTDSDDDESDDDDGGDVSLATKGKGEKTEGKEVRHKMEHL